MRDSGKVPQAEQYFHEMAKLYPDDYIPYLALGDMYTSLDRLDEAEVAYEQGYKLAPQNAAIIAGGSNAAIQNHKFILAKTWVHRSTPAMMDDPRIQREWERSVFFEGKYRESAQFGYKVLAQRPNDLDGAVYLAYSLYNLGRYDDTLALASRYEVVLPKEPNFPLLAGHVHKQQGLLDKAVDDYGRALQRDPKMAEAYVNRGYVLNDLQDAEAAIVDFDERSAVLLCRGDEDRATQGSRRRALTLAIRAQSDVVVDLRALVFADSSLMLDLAALSRRLRHAGRTVRLISPQPQIQRLIELVGLDRLPGVVLEA